jgi:hypothetical protein
MPSRLWRMISAEGSAIPGTESWYPVPFLMKSGTLPA